MRPKHVLETIHRRQYFRIDNPDTRNGCDRANELVAARKSERVKE